MQALVNFSKYKQLKRFNDSLMRIQQEMVQAIKQDRMGGEGRISKATEYDEKESTKQFGEVKKDNIVSAGEVISDSAHTEDEEE